MCFCLLLLVSLRLAFSSCVSALFLLGLFWGLPRSHRLSSHSRLNAFVIQTKLNLQVLNSIRWSSHRFGFSFLSLFRLRAHTLKIEAAAWLEDGSRACDQCPGEDEHDQNGCMLFCQDHRVCELRKHLFSFLFTPFFRTSAAQPFLLQQVNNHYVHDCLSQH